MNLFGILDINSSALTAERERAEVTTSNLANAETTHTPAGGPYKRQLVVFGTDPGPGRFARTLADLCDLHARGVKVEKVIQDNSPGLRRYEPGHPDADADGYVSFPNINPVEEMVNLMGAAQAYQLNVSAAQATKAMISETIQILS